MTWRTLLTLAAVAITACSDLPHDPRGTRERIRRTRVIRVGVAEESPWMVRGAQPRGVEADLIRALARAENAHISWVWGNVESHYRRLESFELDLVAGGLTDDTPWSGRISLTRPYFERDGKKHVMAVPPGENAWLVHVERHLALQNNALERHLAGAGAP